ncbi:MAG: 3-deoxy-manno-octulosonate cytidylyltransferase [Bdellovibrionales bacterium]|nr:3-deoxy-manno-octulosonate cytidylyltransferase [Bdellovibrionales bacterium]
MEITLVIPARYGSTRFPGKPLVNIAGRSLIERVWRIASAVKGVTVLVATDDERIVEHVHSFGGRSVMTPSECRNGSERILAALQQLKHQPDIALNVQGDAVLTPPWILQALVDHMKTNSTCVLSTPAVQLSREQYEKVLQQTKAGIAGGTYVTFDQSGKALYFSKALIPHLRDGVPEDLPVYKHIGIYAYRMETLEQYVSLGPGRFELVEQLEQLRALEHGIPIDVVHVDYRGRTPWSIDLPEDVQEVEAILAREGELVP